MDKLINFNDIKLCNIELAKGWEVKKNIFYDVELISINEKVLIKDLFIGMKPADYWFLFEDELLLIYNQNFDLYIDLGWYPPLDPNGKFFLKLIQAKDWEPLYEFSSRNKDEIVDKLNEIMADVSSGKIK